MSKEEVQLNKLIKKYQIADTKELKRFIADMRNKFPSASKRDLNCLVNEYIESVSLNGYSKID